MKSTMESNCAKVELCRCQYIGCWEKMTCTFTVSQAKDSSTIPPSPIFKPQSRNDVCSPLKV